MQFLKVDMPPARLLRPAQQQSRAECLLALCTRHADATMPSTPTEQNGGEDPFRSPHAAAHCSGSPAGKAVQPVMQAAEGLLSNNIVGDQWLQCSPVPISQAAHGCMQMQAPVGYMNQPATSYTTKFVHVSSNKVRSLLPLHCYAGAWQQRLYSRNCCVAFLSAKIAMGICCY